MIFILTYHTGAFFSFDAGGVYLFFQNLTIDSKIIERLQKLHQRTVTQSFILQGSKGYLLDKEPYCKFPVICSIEKARPPN